MRVCILSDEEIKDFNPAPFMQGYDWEMVTIHEPVAEVLRLLEARKEFDLYINLCEGYDNDDEGDDEKGYEGVEVIQALESLHLPFTGASSTSFDPTREEMQAVADAHNVGFAKGYRVKSVEEAESLAKTLQYPIMVKHPKSYGSTGMFRDSRCDSPDEVRDQVARVCKEFGAARMEEFIVGKEFNVLVVDNPDDFDHPIAYPPAELIFPPGEEFWHTDIKWNYDVPFDFEQVMEPALIARLHDTAIRMFKAMGEIGYGRCDIRMNAKSELFILEINPNPGILLMPAEYGPADYMILYDPGGYKVFLDRIFRVAIARQKMRAVQNS